MEISKEEKELLYQDFKERMIAEGIKTNSKAYKNLHNLERSREYFKTRIEELREVFAFGVWSKNGINWPDWNYIIRLVCHIYGVTKAGDIPEKFLEDANDLAIRLVDEIINGNIKFLNSKGEF